MILFFFFMEGGQFDLFSFFFWKVIILYYSDDGYSNDRKLNCSPSCFMDIKVIVVRLDNSLNSRRRLLHSWYCKQLEMLKWVALCTPPFRSAAWIPAEWRNFGILEFLGGSYLTVEKLKLLSPSIYKSPLIIILIYFNSF